MEKLALQGVNWDRPPVGLQLPLPLPHLTELDFSHLGRRCVSCHSAYLLHVNTVCSCESEQNACKADCSFMSIKSQVCASSCQAAVYHPEAVSFYIYLSEVRFASIARVAQFGRAQGS